MYPVSENYLSAIQANTRNFYYEGEIITKNGAKYRFRNKDIVKGSGYISNQCCDDTEVSIGTVYAAEMGISLYLPIDRYTLEDAEIRLSFFLQLPDGTYEEVPMGIFDISEATRSIKFITLKGYDHMLRFEKDFADKVSSGTAFQLLELACSECDVELAHTQEEVESWENGDTILGFYPENDIETWRDVLYYVAQVLGRFCTINRSGQLELRKYGATPVMTIPSTQRYTSSFSDFITRYTAVNSTNSRTQTAEYYALDPDDGLTMNLGINPLLQFGLEETRKRLITNILNDISEINYVPFESDTIGNPAFDLGDVIVFSGGHADAGQITCITKYEYRINGKHTIKCVGKDPRLSAAKSKNDKNITGLLNQIEAGKIAVYTFINASTYKVKDRDEEICSIEFASTEDTDAEFHASILLKITADKVEKSASTKVKISEEEEETVTLKWDEDGMAKVHITYIINDNTIDTYMPLETLHSGDHVLTLYYPLSGLASNTLNTFRVRMNIKGGSGVIEPSQEICTISGQGLSANNAWDGRLEFSDEFMPYLMGQEMQLLSMFADVEIERQIPAPYGFGDRVPMLTLGATMFLTAVEAEATMNEVITQQTLRFTGNTYTRYEEGIHSLRQDFSYFAAEEAADEGRMEQVTFITHDKTTIAEMEVLVGG